MSRGTASRTQGWIERALQWFCDALLAESDRWFLWAPVLFAVGIGAYFSLTDEPAAAVGAGAVLFASGMAWLFRGNAAALALSLGGVCAALGFADASYRTLLQATPQLNSQATAVTVSGHVVEVRPVLPTGSKFVIKVATIEGHGALSDLNKVRVTSRFENTIATGDAIRVRAVLRPVPRPVMPGAFDFARRAYFDGIGATGFALNAPELWEPGQNLSVYLQAKRLIDGARTAVDARIRSALPDETGAIASALITGERGRISEQTLKALRHSGLAHVLAISGLHMVLMAGTLYWLARTMMASFPSVALRLPIKKIAAGLALTGGAFYLVLSGAAVATQRAYLMMAVMFVAVVLDRPALTLRNVALAALILLAIHPHSLLDVSFQMSFAAALTLVAVYERWSRTSIPRDAATAGGRLGYTVLLYFFGIGVTTLVASIAVAPFAAYHFHKLAQFSLAANLAAMPLVGLLIMPMALATLMAMPLGWEGVPLAMMGAGIEGVVAVAETVSQWPGAVIRISAFPVFTLVMVVLGGLWLMLWRGTWRRAGLVLAAAGLVVAGQKPLPDLLVSRDGHLFAVRDETGALAAPAGRAGRYSLERWLAAQGDARSLTEVRSGRLFSCDETACVTAVKGKTIAFLFHPAALREECASADIVISRFPLGRRCRHAQAVLDRVDLKHFGAHALYIEGHTIRIESVAEQRGRRPWTRFAD